MIEFANFKEFVPGTGNWQGVIVIERPRNPMDTSPCKVMSARSIVYDGRRMISQLLPYALVKQYFRLQDGDSTYWHAELKAGALQLSERARKIDFFLLAGSPPPAVLALPPDRRIAP